jgi:hypothetical protein
MRVGKRGGRRGGGKSGGGGREREGWRPNLAELDSSIQAGASAGN